jgi:hypothetical protein
MHVLCERRDGSPVVVAGPCWPFCCGVTLPAILGISGAVSYFVIFSDSSPLVRARNSAPCLCGRLWNLFSVHRF